MKKMIFLLTAVISLLICGCSGKRDAGKLLNKAYKSALNADWQTAYSCSKEAVSFQPGSADAHIIYALSLENLQKPEEALEEISRAIKLEPQDFFALYTKGRILYELGQFESCIQPLLSALRKRPNDFNTLILLAQSYRRINDPASAVFYYSKLAGQSAFRKNQAVWNELAISLLLNRKSPDYAGRYLIYAYSLNRQTPSVILNMAILYDRYLPAKRATGRNFYAYYLRQTANNSALAEKRAAVEARLKAIR